MRIPGVLLLSAAFFLAGLCSVREKKKKLRALRELCAALDLMRDELELRVSSVPELCEYLKSNCAGAAGQFFTQLSGMLTDLGDEPLSALWERALAASFGTLGEQADEALRRLGAVLGRYELDAQLRELQACAWVLKNAKEEAERSYPAEKRLLLGLGAAAGAFAAIMII